MIYAHKPTASSHKTTLINKTQNSQQENVVLWKNKLCYLCKQNTQLQEVITPLQQVWQEKHFEWVHSKHTWFPFSSS